MVQTTTKEVDTEVMELHQQLLDPLFTMLVVVVELTKVGHKLQALI